MSGKKVCMFVWNYFTNDARVLRECMALAEAGYAVDLIAIHDWHNKELRQVETFPAGFIVYRLSNRLRSPLAAFRKMLLVFLFFCLFGFFFYPVITSILLVGCLLLAVPKVRKLLVRGDIFLQMVRFGMKKKYDIYHANDLNTLLQGVICAKLFGRRKLIYDSHEVQTSRTGYNSSIYGLMERWLLPFADKVINENHTRAAYTQKRYGIYPEVVHNYPFASKPEAQRKIDLHDMLKLPSEEPILLYQGGLQTGRGLEKIIQAVPLLKKGIVVFIGDGKIKPQLEAMVAEMKLTDRVKFFPKVPVQDLPAYTQNAYLGFQLLNNTCFNHYSASSNKLFEYMMGGVPVIACSFPEIKRVVEKERTGICVDSHDSASIAKAVNELLEHPDEREQMSRNCLQAREKYNWDLEKEGFLQIYQTV